ncbi:MAG: sugar ABC transporter permease [Rhodobacteraceae bacterium]|nr:sugar ABC transporter permease [Paracoccaceae bacterium]MCY4140829.1 sugar ABC transporter permease [Paracoccaceae bacterium]
MATRLTRQNRAGWMMAGPAFLLIVVFLILPFIMAIGFSFTNQRLVSPNPTEWIGTRNYERLFSMAMLTLEAERDESGAVKMKDGEPVYPRLRSYTRNRDDYPQYFRKREWFHIDRGDGRRTYVLASDVVFLKALRNTVFFVAVVAPLQAGLALCLALLINRRVRGINVFRAIYFMPVVISMVVVSMLWRFIYDGQNGLLNTLLQFASFGLFEPVDWLGLTSTALPSIMAMSIWQGVGFHMIIWLSGLQTIPATFYEAARVEGSSRWQTFRYITWPGLRNTAILVMIIITMQAFTLFPQVAVMTNGGPLDSTQSIVFQMVERGYGKQDISGGSTISVFLFLFVLSISLLQRWLTREKS